jgi:intein/homing endonuclease/cellulose biosynthesis protein BcsQ
VSEYGPVPEVIVVGSQALADAIVTSGIQALVHPAQPTVNAMWDAIDAKKLPSSAVALIVADGSGADVDEVESGLAAFAPYAMTFLIADGARGPQILARTQELAGHVRGGDPTRPVYLLPAHDLAECLRLLQQALAGKVEWVPQFPAVTPTAPPAAPPAQQYPVQYPPQPPAPPVQIPVQQAPVQQYPPQPPAPPVQQYPVQQPAPPVQQYPVQQAPVQQAPQTAYAQPAVEYEQASVYGSAVAAVAGQVNSKRPDAIPLQKTIACMSSKGGSGKCLTGDALVLDPATGLRRRIDDIVASTDPTHVAAFDGRFMSSHPVSNRFYSGIKPTFRVRLRSGREITATDNHPLLTSGGWTELGTLAAGDTIATPARLPLPAAPVDLDPAELDLLALLMAEGGTTGRQTRFTNFDPSIIAVADAAATKLGATLVEVQAGQPGQYRLSGGHPMATVIPQGICQCGCGRATQLAPNANAYRELGYQAGEPTRFVKGHWNTESTLRNLRRTHGLDFVAAKNKTMPAAVFRLGEEQLARFIALFWMCDGYAVTKSGGDLGVTLASKDLIEALQHLLLRLGIVSKIAPRVAKAGGKEFQAYRLTVYSTSYAAFEAKIPLWGDKADRVSELAARSAAAANPNVGLPTFSEQLRADLYAVRDSSTTGQVAKKLGWTIATHVSPSMVLFHKAAKRSGRQHLSLRGLQAWAEVTGTEETFGWIYDSEIFWDEIESVTPAGEAMVYDIEVPGPHNFSANDIIVHNSTTAISLAGMIAKASAAAGDPKRVVLVDLDTRDGQVGSLIAQYIPTALSIRVAARWDAETVKANLVHDKRLGIDALLAPIRPRNADDVGPDFYRQIIQVLQTTHDVVILDCSVNYLDPLLGVAFSLADEILFVTTLATTSVQGMARALTELFADPAEGGLGIPHEKVGIVANQVLQGVGMGRQTLLRAALGAELIGQIPADHDAVLIHTNQNRMDNLLKHPLLGPAYFSLAQRCLAAEEGWNLAPISTEAAVRQAAEPEQPGQTKRRLFGPR